MLLGERGGGGFWVGQPRHRPARRMPSPGVQESLAEAALAFSKVL